MGNRFATTPEIIRISKLLELHCKKVNGLAVYNDGWDDQTIATAVAEDLTAHHVGRVRQDIIGRLYVKKKVEWTLAHEVMEVKKGLGCHDADIADLVKAHNALADAFITFCAELGTKIEKDVLFIEVKDFG